MKQQNCKLLAVTVDGTMERSLFYSLKAIPISSFCQNVLAFLYCHGEFWFMSLTVEIQWISRCQFLCTLWYTYNSLSATVISFSPDIPKWQKANHWWSHSNTRLHAHTQTGTQTHTHTVIIKTYWPLSGWGKKRTKNLILCKEKGSQISHYA